MKLSIPVAVFLALAGATAAESTIRYEFTAFSSFPINVGNGDEIITGGFVLEVPGFIVPNTTIPAADLISCTISGSISGAFACGGQGFLNDIFPPYETVSFSGPSFSIFYYYNAGTFGTPGVYGSELFGDAQFGELTITDLDGPVIPEPATWAMLVAGFGLVGSALRRRGLATVRA
jgi:hypothetical protein